MERLAAIRILPQDDAKLPSAGSRIIPLHRELSAQERKPHVIGGPFVQNRPDVVKAHATEGDAGPQDLRIRVRVGKRSQNSLGCRKLLRVYKNPCKGEPAHPILGSGGQTLFEVRSDRIIDPAILKTSCPEKDIIKVQGLQLS
jgi:hypothetical protein